jgi:hypothetical protein
MRNEKLEMKKGRQKILNIECPMFNVKGKYSAACSQFTLDHSPFTI